MPREHARLLIRIWNDDDFLALEKDPQRTYMLLISQPGINWAGVLSLTSRRWAKFATNSAAEELHHDLKVLEHARFVVVDYDTEELLVRSFIRNDGVAKQPNVLASAIKSAREVQSPRLRTAIAEELRRIEIPEPKSAKAKWPDVLAVADELAPKGAPAPPPEGFPEPFENPSANPEPGESENTRSKPLGEGFTEPSPEPFTEPPGDGEGVTTTSKGHLEKGVALRTRAHAHTRTRGIDHAELAATAHKPLSYRIVAAWNERHGRDYPTRTLRALAKQVDVMLADRGQPEIVDAALELWHGKQGAAPGLLPHLYSDALKAKHAATRPPAVETSSKSAAYRALADELRREEEAAAQHEIGARRGPIGIVIEGEAS